MNIELEDIYKLKKFMPSSADIRNLSNFYYAFSDATRLKIIILLTMKALCVSDIVDVLNINQTTVSHQLKILKSLDIVDADRTGKNVVYYIKNHSIEEVLNVSVDCI